MLWLSVLFSFVLSFAVMPLWIRKARKVGLVWEDMNKFNRPKDVAASGGIIVVMAFLLGVLSYVAIKTFLFGNAGYTLEIFSLLSMILILGLVGLTDDLLGWKHGGLQKRTRIGLAFLASIPLVVINAGTSTMTLPFFGSVNFGLLYPLLIVPLAIAFVTTTYNFLAGFNGLEAGMGVLVLSFLSYVAYVSGSGWLAIVGLCMVASLLGFYLYNKCPAQVFPGDILTYSVGALIAGMAILGNFEKIAFVVFVPFIIETLLKSSGKLKKQSFGIPDKKGNLKMPYKKIYGLTHFSIWFLSQFKKKVSEKDVVYLIFVIQIIFIFLAFSLL
jgi:UDP-N-acetylglucosamine--dolichyl-phosphate N-acetylglucosaminephosphotransferase